MAQNYDIKNRLWWEMVEINLRIFSGRKKLLLITWWWKWKSRYIFISKGEIYLPNVWLWWWWRWWWMMMTMMTRIRMENRKEQLEKNYLPSGWPDPGSPRCRNCAKRIVTIHTQKCYFLKEIITIRTERQYFFLTFLLLRNYSEEKRLISYMEDQKYFLGHLLLWTGSVKFVWKYWPIFNSRVSG